MCGGSVCHGDRRLRTSTTATSPYECLRNRSGHFALRPTLPPAAASTPASTAASTAASTSTSTAASTAAAARTQTYRASQRVGLVAHRAHGALPAAAAAAAAALSICRIDEGVIAAAAGPEANTVEIAPTVLCHDPTG